MFNYVEAQYELRRRMAVLDANTRGELTDKETLTKINEMVIQWTLEHPEEKGNGGE